MFKVTEAWRAAHPDAHAGFLVMGDVENPARHPGLEAEKHALEARLRAQFAGRDRHALETFGPIPAYTAYYKQFDKTYHVLAQLASIVFKGKAIPSVAALVEAMFMAEVKNGLLTAGHDLDRLQLPITVGVAGGEERYTLLRGQAQGLKAGDMLMADRAGVISSIVYGPDERTQITAATRNALFAVYAPAGIDVQAVLAHLRDVRDYVLVVAPTAKVGALQVLPG
jgi:DNA/RNA-binding domain of Phe-tRNA-synthetase-like protein